VTCADERIDGRVTSLLAGLVDDGEEPPKAMRSATERAFKRCWADGAKAAELLLIADCVNALGASWFTAITRDELLRVLRTLGAGGQVHITYSDKKPAQPLRLVGGPE